MDTTLRTRYPGAQPFVDEELSRKLFRGREQETLALTSQIVADRLVVLFARSGLGKTSLLNAGVAENLRACGFVPLSVRVGDSAVGALESVYRGIAEASTRQGVEYVAGSRLSLWHFFKTAEFWRDDFLLTPVLVLDQFEELFTLQAEVERNAFIDQLSHLVRGVRPPLPEADSADTAQGSVPLDDSPPAVRVLVSLREDFLAELEEISNRIPGILDQRFRLLPLARAAAAKALEEPAEVRDPTLATNPFSLEPEARNAILDFLEQRTVSSIKRSSSNIEPFQLQLICQRLEEIAKHKEIENSKREPGEGPNDRVAVSLADVGGESELRSILKGFYNRQILAISSWRQRRRARRLCGEFLISPQGRRLRMEETEIVRLVGVEAETLRTLVDRRLLRADPTAEGTYYELSHDSLIMPVLYSRRVVFVARVMGLLVFVAVAILLTLVFGVSWILIGIGLFVEKVGEELGVTGQWRYLAYLLLVICFVVFIGLLRWARANIRGLRDTWRRSRI